MRTLSLTLAAAMAVAGTTSAQAIFEIYPGTTSATTRGNIGLNSGELQQGFHSAVNRGLGDTNGTCNVNGARYLIQDQVGATTGSYRVVIRSGTDAAGPDPLTTGVIAQTGVLNYPASTATGAVAWFITLTFTTPVAVPCENFWSFGLELPIPVSSTDFESVHTAYGTVQYQHANATDITWQIIGGAVSHPASKRTLRIAPIFTTALQAANIDGNGTLTHFGNGGFFPDTALTGTGPTSQGLAFKVTHPAGAAGQAAVFGSVTGFTATPFALPGVGNRVYLDLLGFLSFSVAAGIPNGSTLNFLAPGVDAIPSAAGGMISFQAAVLDGATGAVDLTNAVGVVLF